jgi:RNA polymerase sigma-70 factor (ECF subfamily)
MHRHEDAEQAIRQAFEQHGRNGGTEAILRAYGPEILGFLVRVTEDELKAQEAFSLFAEWILRGIEGFQWRSMARTWAYVLARNAARRVHSTQPGKLAPLPEHISRIAEEIRSATQPHLRTDVKDRARLLRARLDPDDQQMLVLRVDRGLSWRDTAMVMLGDTTASEEALVRKTATLRKRFERIKEQLRELAREDEVLADHLED